MTFSTISIVLILVVSILLMISGLKKQPVIGSSPGAITINGIFSSVVFGLSHGYQERCGILSTGIVGALLAIIFAWSDFNLWLAIFTHGFIDTVGIAMIAMDADKAIRKRIWKD